MIDCGLISGKIRHIIITGDNGGAFFFYLITALVLVVLVSFCFFFCTAGFSVIFTLPDQSAAAGWKEAKAEQFKFIMAIIVSVVYK